MPRRRKKSNLAQKPSLVFTESPLHIQKNVPSPVLCARHPPTAPSIPVEDACDLHWVSPQFRNVRHSGGYGKRRLTRQRRHSIAAHKNVSSCVGNKENFQKGVAAGSSKFKSLKFIGDQTTVPSIVEDIEVTIDTDTDDGEICEGFNSEIVETDSPFDGHKTEHKFDINLCIPRQPSGKLGSQTKQSESAPRINYTKNDKNDIKTVAVGERMIQDFPGDNSEENQSPNGTQRRNSMKEKPPIKRLFANQLSSNCGTGGGKLCQVNSQHFDNVKYTHSGAMTEMSEQLVAVPDSEDEPANSPSLRRSARIREVQKRLQDSDSPRSGTTQALRKPVLAPDTPENEYGWSKRKRQLIQYIKKKS